LYDSAFNYVNSSRKKQIFFGGVVLPLTFLLVTRAYLRSRAPRFKKMSGGLHKEITLPRKSKNEDIELYHNCVSTCSMKVRLCLAEKQIPYVSNHVHLIETGWYETCSPAYGRINPSKVVPVLVFKGNPVYESDEIIKFIDKELDEYAQVKTTLQPTNQNSRMTEIMDRWVDQGSTKHDEKRLTPADELAVLSVPAFTAMIQYIPYRSIFYGFIYHFDIKRPLYFTLMKLLGVRFVKNPAFLKKFKHVRSQMSLALSELNDNLKETGGDYICGKAFTLADIAWIPILARLEEAGQEQLYQQYEFVDKYWQTCKNRECVQKAIYQVSEEFPIVEKGHLLLSQWRQQYPEIDTMLNP